MAVSIPDSQDNAPGSRPAETADARVRALRGARDDQSARPHTGPRSIAEWVTLTVSSLIVLGLIGLTTYFYVTAPNTPAAVEVEPDLSAVYQSGSRYYLPVMVRNTGGETGEEVRVRVSLTDPSGRQETAELMVQFLAGGGSSQAVVAFGSDPRQGQVEAVVMSYLEP